MWCRETLLRKVIFHCYSFLHLGVLFAYVVGHICNIGTRLHTTKATHILIVLTLLK